MDPRMDPTVNSTMDPSSGADDSAGDRFQQYSQHAWDSMQLFGDDCTNPVKLMPNQVQMVARCDEQGRRYMVLENLPLDKNYVANCINSGGEFA